MATPPAQPVRRSLAAVVALIAVIAIIAVIKQCAPPPTPNPPYKAPPAASPAPTPEKVASPSAGAAAAADGTKGMNGVNPDEQEKIDAAIENVRQLLARIETAHSELLFESETSWIIRLHPPSTEELDSVYHALTKAVNAFPPASAPAKLLRGKAEDLIRKFSVYDMPGQLLLFRRGKSPGEVNLSVRKFSDANAEVIVEPDGTADIIADQIRCVPLSDWNSRNSTARYRYQHFLPAP